MPCCRTQAPGLHEIRIGEELRRVSDETCAAEVAGPGVPEPAEQVVSPEFPVHADEADHHRLQNAQPRDVRL